MNKLINLASLQLFYNELKNVFVEKSALGAYLKTSDAAAAYQAKGNYITAETAASTYQTKGSYLTTTDAAATYQAKGSYLTTSVAAATYAKKSDIAKAVQYRGTVDTYSALPKNGMAVGDMYNITKADKANDVKAGDNAVWNGNSWDILGGVVDLSDYATKAEVTNAVSGAINAIDIATEAEVKGLFTVGA